MRFFLILIPALLLISCSRKSEEQLFTEGRSNEDQKFFQLAIENYRELVIRYPKGQHAEEAQYRVALIFNNDIRDMQRAVDSYRTFLAMFPESKDAPSAMFLAAFLYNNELHRLDSAKALYESFLQKYPN
ncbi:MAG TPA: tetratricopeptide repeat protein, partial [Bacteroidota bacterium]|nr:tetratricopeptide repeat protein [Bacteroidota bacterium]